MAKSYKPQNIDVPASVIEAYIKWLRDPRGTCFGFCVATRVGVVDVTLPLIKVRHG